MTPPTCKKCTALNELFEATEKSDRLYWVMTELFVMLHGSDVCSTAGKGIERAGQVTAWWPIDSAPKDGTLIDAWCRTLEEDGDRPDVQIRITDVAWESNFKDGRGENGGQGWSIVNADGNYGWVNGPCCEGGLGWNVTHWRPVPAPPNSAPPEHPPEPVAWRHRRTDWKNDIWAYCSADPAHSFHGFPNIKIEPLYAAPPSAPEPVGYARWILWYEDKDRTPEHFSHDGGEAAAYHRFEQASIAWTCTLFQAIRKSGFGPEDAYPPSAKPEPVAWDVLQRQADALRRVRSWGYGCSDWDLIAEHVDSVLTAYDRLNARGVKS